MSLSGEVAFDPEVIFDLWKDINSSQNVDEICYKACVAAVKTLSVDHSTFVRFERALDFGLMTAEFYSEHFQSNMKMAQGMRIPLEGIPEEVPLLTKHEPIICFDVTTLKPGRFKDNLCKLGIKSTLIVPVVWNEELLGSFSLDTIRDNREFTSRDIKICTLLATGIALALHNAEVLGAERFRAELLTKLNLETDNLSSSNDAPAMAQGIVAGIMSLSGWKFAILYRYDDEPTKLVALAQTPLNHIGERLFPEEIKPFSQKWIWEHLIQKDETLCIIDRDDHPELFSENQLLRPFHRALAMNLKSFWGHDSLLLVLDNLANRPHLKIQLEYFERFSDRVSSIAVKTVWEAVGLRFLRLTTINPTNGEEFASALFNCVTLLTANFGLRFNRALLFQLDDSQQMLVPQIGVGQFSQQEWEACCVDDKQQETDTFDGWMDKIYTSGTHTPTQIEQWFANEAPICLDLQEGALLNETLSRNRPVTLRSAEDFERLPSQLRAAMNPTAPVILVPLCADETTLGLVWIDREFTKEVLTARDFIFLQHLCDRTATLMKGFLLSQRVLGASVGARQTFATFPNEGLEFLTETDILAQIAEVTRQVFDAAHTGVCLITDFQGRYQERVLTSMNRDSKLGEDVLQSSIAQTVIIDRIPHAFDSFSLFERDRVLLNLEFEFLSGLCLPLSVESKIVGLVWAFFSSRYTAMSFEFGALQRYCSEVDQVYGHWRQLRDLRDLDNATTALAAKLSSPGFAQEIAQVAKDILEADAITWWPYDSSKRIFSREGMVQFGFDDWIPTPAPDGDTYDILRVGYKFVENIANVRVSAGTARLFEKRRWKSGQGIAVRIAGDNAAVLYAAYTEVRRFSLREKRKLNAFAARVGLLLDAARQLQHGNWLGAASREVPRVLVTGDVGEPLRAIAKLALTALRSDVIGIFQYDDESHSLRQPLVLEGNFPPMQFTAADLSDAVRLVEKLKDVEMTIAHNYRELEGVSTRFMREHHIIAGIAIWLTFSSRKVGLMVLGYQNEISEAASPALVEAAQTFGYEAALAIANAQRSRALWLLSKSLLEEVDQKIIFEKVVELAVTRLDVPFCTLILKEEGQLRIVAQRGWGNFITTEVVEPGIKSHAGRTIEMARPIGFLKLENIVDFEPPLRMRDAGVASGQSVPVVSNEGVLGALLVHSKTERIFSSEDVDFLALVASQALVAKRNAQRLQRLNASLKAAQVVVAAVSIESKELALRALLEIAREHIVDENGKSKIAHAAVHPAAPSTSEWKSIELGTALATGTGENIQRRLEQNDVPEATILFQSPTIRHFDRQDMKIIDDIVALANIVIK
jgi:GAF domain-containing protein